MPDRPRPRRRPRGRLASRLRQLFSSHEEQVAEELVRESVASGATPIAEAKSRTRVVLRGTVAIVALAPRGRNKWLEVDLADGTGTVTLIWMGRASITGIRPGSKLSVEGLLAEQGERRVMFNPAYRIISA